MAMPFTAEEGLVRLGFTTVLLAVVIVLSYLQK